MAKQSVQKFFGLFKPRDRTKSRQSDAREAGAPTAITAGGRIIGQRRLPNAEVSEWSPLPITQPPQVLNGRTFLSTSPEINAFIWHLTAADRDIFHRDNGQSVFQLRGDSGLFTAYPKEQLPLEWHDTASKSQYVSLLVKNGVVDINSSHIQGDNSGLQPSTYFVDQASSSRGDGGRIDPPQRGAPTTGSAQQVPPSSSTTRKILDFAFKYPKNAVKGLEKSFRSR